MKAQRLAGTVLTPQGFVAGELAFDAEGRVAHITGEAVEEVAVRDRSGPIVLPGFVDLHVHGGLGRDIMEAGDAAREVARCHAAHGTTALLATTMTAPMDDLRAAFRALAPACSTRERGAARVLGVHLEGPYINPGKLGAQPDFARAVSIDELGELHAIAPIRVVTLAPEMPGHLQDIPQLVQRGWRVQIGHSTGGYEDGVQALRQGALGFTHLFNAMTGLHHREPGMAGAALAHGRFAEIIPDLLHVHPGAIRVALRAIPRLYCVTDSTAAAGMPDGDYKLGRQTVTKCMGGVRLPDGTLAGSTLTMDQALRNLVDELGLSLSEASQRTATHAADYLGLQDRGRLAPGAWGDAVLLDRDLRLQAVFIEGERVELANAA